MKILKYQIFSSRDLHSILVCTIVNIVGIESLVLRLGLDLTSSNEVPNTSNYYESDDEPEPPF